MVQPRVEVDRAFIISRFISIAEYKASTESLGLLPALFLDRGVLVSSCEWQQHNQNVYSDKTIDLS